MFFQSTLLLKMIVHDHSCKIPYINNANRLLTRVIVNWHQEVIQLSSDLLFISDGPVLFLRCPRGSTTVIPRRTCSRFQMFGRNECGRRDAFCHTAGGSRQGVCCRRRWSKYSFCTVLHIIKLN